MIGRVKTEIELRMSCSDTMLKYWLSQKLKLLKYYEFNHLTIILTNGNIKIGFQGATWFSYNLTAKASWKYMSYKLILTQTQCHIWLVNTQTCNNLSIVQNLCEVSNLLALPLIYEYFHLKKKLFINNK